MSEPSRVRIGGVCEPFWRHLNTVEWEPEWQSLVGVLDREHLTSDLRRAFDRLEVDFEETDSSGRVVICSEWMGYLEDVWRHDKKDELCEIFTALAERNEYFTFNRLAQMSLAVESIDEQHALLRLVRGMCLCARSLRSQFVGDLMQDLLGRLEKPLDLSPVICGEMLELLLVIISESTECQRDFMRRNGITTVCGLYANSDDKDELFERSSTFIGLLLQEVLPKGASTALNNALTAEAKEAVDEALGENEAEKICKRLKM